MKIWVAHVGEPLPIDAENERQLRMSLFARQLADAGHDVTWWTSTFDHTHKRQRFNKNTIVRVDDRLTLRLLWAKPYKSNISIDRLINHRQVAKAFASLAPLEDQPDLIFATLPTVELAAAVSRFGLRYGVPVVIDVRDLHPDIYLSLVPAFAKPIARRALTPLYRDVRTALSLATAIFAIAPSFLDWALGHAGRNRRKHDAVFPLAYPRLLAPSEAIAKAGRDLAEMGVREDRNIIWYVGTFNRWIDLETPIRAARVLHELGAEDFQFVFSGSGDFEPEWRKLARDLPNVVFTGWIDIPALLHMKRIAWAGLAPYRPGFLTVGNKLFEYMAGALPILLSIEGDAKRIVEESDAGIYYAGNVEQLVAAVRKLDRAGVQARMAAASRLAFEERYSADKVYSRMQTAVLELAEEGRDAI